MALNNKRAMYRVELGILEKGIRSDNWNSFNVLALDAIEASKKISLKKGEYVASVILLSRSDQ